MPPPCTENVPPGATSAYRAKKANSTCMDHQRARTGRLVPILLRQVDKSFRARAWRERETINQRTDYKYSYPIQNVIRPSGSRRMFVMWTEYPSPLIDRLDGVVYGVKA